MSDKAMYGLVAVALLVLGYGLFGMPSAQQQSATIAYSQPAAGAYQFSQQQATVPPECGNINDPANLQHLSHHPDQFQACYKVVDPVKFRAAVGRDVSEFIGQGGSSGQDSMAGHHE